MHSFVCCKFNFQKFSLVILLCYLMLMLALTLARVLLSYGRIAAMATGRRLPVSKSVVAASSLLLELE